MLAEDAAHAAYFNNIRRVAFTLAEVLITLGVIGIVAALTMPALIGNYKRKQTVTQLKKVYSSMQQSIQMSQAEYGDIRDWDWSQNGQDFFTQYLGKNFNVVKNCGTEQGCWNSTGILTLSGKEYSPNPLKSSGWSSLILSDGVYIYLLKQDNNHYFHHNRRDIRHLFVHNGCFRPMKYKLLMRMLRPIRCLYFQAQL